MINTNVMLEKIGNVLELQRGYDLPTDKRIPGDIPIISSSGYTGYHNAYKCDGENVVTGRYGTIGEVYYHNGRCWPLNTSLFVKDFKGNNPRYIYYFLKNALCLYKVSGSDKSTVPGIDRKVIHDMRVPFYKDIYYQSALCDVLGSIDKKIRCNQIILIELESMSKTLYDYWFVQFDFPDENGNPYRSSGGKMVWNEQLKREIPKRWNVTNIGNLTTVVTGKEDANFSSPNGKYKFFTCSQETLLCDTPAFSGQAVLIAGNGDFNVKHYSGEFNAYQRTYVLIPENQVYYGAMYISAKNQIQAFKNGSNGSIVKFITKGDVENIPFILPNDDSIFHQINKLIEKIELCERENEELTKFRDWLLPMLMNGQARVE